jgi:hypothetical protein
VLLVMPAAASPVDTDRWLRGYATSVAAGLDPRVSGALARIPETGPRLLALRSYLRAGDTLAARWSWTAEQIREYEASAEFRDVQTELDRVLAAFAAAFPGHTLYVNREVRSLELQLERWNSNRSVDTAAQSLLAELHRGYRKRHGRVDADWLRQALAEWTPAQPATLAAPGLSAHGQARAFDFQIERDGQIVAGTESEHTARDWDGSGWTGRLKQLIGRVSTRLHGPLESPWEPWHYVYTPAAERPPCCS